MQSPEQTGRGGTRPRWGLAPGARGYAVALVLLLLAATLPGSGRGAEVHVLRTEVANARATLVAAGGVTARASPVSQRPSVRLNRTAMGVQARVRVAERHLRDAEAELDRVLTTTAGSSVLAGLLEQARSLVRPTRDAQTAGRLAVPVSGVITSGFGPRRVPSWGDDHMHDGIDIFAPSGAPVTAAADGDVTFAGLRPESGLTVILEHGRDGNGRLLETVYSHLSAVEVDEGQRVRTSEVVGAVGSTGTHSTGPHLHFEVRIEGQAVDPRAWL